MEITEEQRRRAEANRLAALEKRKRAAETTQHQQPPDAWRLLKCPKVTPPPPPPPPPPPAPGFRVVLEICSPDEFSVSPEPLDDASPFPGATECFRAIQDCLLSIVPFSVTQSQNGHLASIFKLSNYDRVLKGLKLLRHVKIQEVPYKTRLVVEKFAPCSSGAGWVPVMEEHCTDEQVEDLLAGLPASLRDALLPFQLEGVRFGLRRGGRCLIADEMGLGKTLQAIAIACCFRAEGSILIVCPAVLRYSWAEELERWIPIFLPNDIHLVFGHQNSLDHLEHSPKVVIISYKMLSRLKKSMMNKEWALMIIDESHNIRCTKKKTEKDETKTILELAPRIKRIVLLSGTPSLSRPYDIYHQINILWPQLLGSNKYEFAKKYCLLRTVKGVQGKSYQDFSKGTRLSELNVLLRQTLMIRRLKEHVLDQLPPKRRQIIRLKLKAADIQLASAACRERRSDICYSQHQNTHCDGIDQADVQGGDGCKKLLKDLSPQELGIAKLSGFSEWFSNHCITSKVPDNDIDDDMQYDIQKTIIFGHHLKVLDGIQASISSNGIKFVRIDGSTFPKERQNAVESFRLSSEVKVAIIGITAGGVGLDFSSAQNVIFLELPKTASDMLQAEDRAHRRGQKNAVNIYIFCAKGTSDELNWSRLNKNLFSVSSVMNGKKDAINEFEVEDVYSFSRGSDDQVLTEELDSTAKQTTNVSRLQVIEEPETMSYDREQINEDFPIHTVPFIVMDKDHDSSLQEQAQMDLNEENCGIITSLDGDSSCISRKFKQRIMPSACTRNHEDVSLTERRELGAIGEISAEYLRFEVSQHTGRIHLYVCIPDRDIRPRPLYENIRPEEIESPIYSGKGLLATLLLKRDTEYHHVLQKFLSEWGNLRPIERNKLLGKPLQLPLSIELCYLKESKNHDFQGLLKGGSNRRVTPRSDINDSLPENAVWKKIILHGGHNKKLEYTQAWIGDEQPLCKLCQKPCNGKLAKSPEYFEDLFCNLTCFQEYRIRTSRGALRQALFQIEHGICDNCKLDCSALVKCLRPLSVKRRIEYIKKFAPNIAAKKKLLNKIVNEPTEGNSWHADHKVPVYQGGGECTLENLRTLCVACHNEVTKAQCLERKLIRRRAKELLKNVSKENEKEEDDGDLLVSVPGSSYSKRETDVSAIVIKEHSPIVPP